MNAGLKLFLAGVVGAIVCFGGMSTAQAAVVTMQPDNGKDAQVDAGQPDSNFGVYGDITTNWWHGKQNVGLIEFDLSDFLGDEINAAVLGVYHSTNNVPGSVFGIYRITSAWSESTVTWDTRPSTVSTPDATLTMPTGYGWREWDITALVQGWAAGTYDNYGMMLARIDQASPVAYFSSSDRSSVTSAYNFDPRLTLEYADASTPNAVPEPASMVLFGAGLAGAFLRRRFV